jgi:cystathionine beta-lyase
VGGPKHTPAASLSPELEKKTITLMAPSKTFNLAGMAASFAIIPDPRLRKRFQRARAGQSGVNALGLVAMEAALRHGDDYLAQLNDYLAGNVRYFAEAIAPIPGLRLVPAEGPEGTYLAWVDMRELGLPDEKLRDFMLRRARLATSFGYEFGPGGQGFQRFNLGCPRGLVAEAVSRLGRAVGAPAGPGWAK